MCSRPGEALGGDFAGGVRAVVEVALQSPEFLYRVEVGEPVGVGAAAARAPDALRDGRAPVLLLLGVDAGSDARAGREPGEPAHPGRDRGAGAAAAHGRSRARRGPLLHLPADGASTTCAICPAWPSTPGFTQEIADLTLEETRSTIDEITWRGAGDFQSLLTSPVSFLNGPLAAFYGVPGVTGDGFTKVSLDPARRAGLLTQPSVLARSSNGTSSSPSNRGSWSRSRLLCDQTPGRRWTRRRRRSRAR